MAIDVTFTVPKSNTGIYSIPIGVGGGGGVLSNSSIGPGRFPAHLYDDSVLHHFLKDHQIQGQTIMAEYILPPNYLSLKESEIKGLLIEKLVQEMYSQKNIEFTQMRKVETDEMVYRARIHVVPDTQVRIIRELKDARKTT
jgi:hypothetical protein